MRKHFYPSITALSIIFLTLFNASLPAFAEEFGTADAHEADRVVLRKLLADIELAINENEISKLLPYLDENVVITHQNAHVARGKAEVVSYNEKMTKGPDAPIKKLTTKATIGGPAYFHGNDMAIGYGTAVDQVELKSGQEFSLNVAWSAALIRKEGIWKAAAIHFSTNVLDNAVLRQVRKMVWWSGGGGVVLGLVAGWFFGRRKYNKAG